MTPEERTAAEADPRVAANLQPPLHESLEAGSTRSLQIKNANSSIREILSVANFDQLMQID